MSTSSSLPASKAASSSSPRSPPEPSSSSVSYARLSADAADSSATTLVGDPSSFPTLGSPDFGVAPFLTPKRGAPSGAPLFFRDSPPAASLSPSLSAHSWNCSSIRPELSSPSARRSTRSPPSLARAWSRRRAAALKRAAPYSRLPHPKTANFVSFRCSAPKRSSPALSSAQRQSHRAFSGATALPSASSYVEISTSATGAWTRSSGSKSFASVVVNPTPCRVRSECASLCASRRAVPVCEPNRIRPLAGAAAGSAAGKAADRSRAAASNPARGFVAPALGSAAARAGADASVSPRDASAELECVPPIGAGHPPREDPHLPCSAAAHRRSGSLVRARRDACA